MIFVDRTYSEVTPESAENGDTSDSGFISTNEPCGFRELVELMREHAEPSEARSSPHTWFSTGYSVKDYQNGTERETCIHFSRINPPLAEKYWVKAARAAGVCK